MTAATHTRQASRTPLGLALLLERGGATLVAPARTLAAGVVLEAFAAGVEGARPGSTAGCRGRRCVVREVGLKVELAALEAWVLGRVSGGLPGWSVEQVLVDMSEGTGAVWTLRGRDEAGATAWLRVELAVVVDAGRVRLRAGRCWWLGPPGSTAARQWRALGRKLCGGGVGWVRGELVVEVLRAAVGAEFAAAGWRLPVVERARLRVDGGAVVWGVGGEGWSEGQVGWSEGQVGWPEGQVDAGWSEGQVGWPEGQVVGAGFDPLGRVRGWLRGDRGERARADRALAELATAVPAIAGELGRARVAALRFLDRDGCVAALRAWALACPEDGEPRWLLVVQQALRGDQDGVIAALGELVAAPGDELVKTRRSLALAIALARRDAGAAEARALLEPLVAGLPRAPQELQAAVWRALARARAADAAAPGVVVEDAVAAALGEEGWRRRGETGELRAQVAAALVASGRGEADTTRLLRRMLGDERPRGERAVREDRSDPRGSARIVADYYAQEGRWAELVTLLGRELVTLDGVARIQALRRIARIYRHYLHDPASAEQALRAALAQPGDDEGTRHDRLLLHGELVTCLEMQGRFAEAALHLEGALAPELADGEVSEGTGSEIGPERVELLLRLGRLARDGLEDEGRAAPAFAALLRAGAVPEDGLASLARVYRGDGRYAALAGVLRAQLGRVDRVVELRGAADLQRRLAELLAGPLQRGEEAAGHYLVAYLAEPELQAACGARARALLGAMAAEGRRAVVVAALEWLPETAVRAVRAWTLAGEAAGARAGEEAVRLLMAALASGGVVGVELAEGTGGEEASFAELAEGTGSEAGAWTVGEEDEEEGLSAALGVAAAGLGRALLAVGRGVLAMRALGFAAGRRGLADAAAIDCAVLAARTAVGLGRAGEAEAVLTMVRRERPAEARVLLELSKVFDVQERRADEDATLAELVTLAGTPGLRAEVLLRRAELRDYADDPRGGAGEEAMGLLLAAFAAEPRHVESREALRALAEARGAWSTVVQTIAAGLRGASAGGERAGLHVDLAEVHLLQLGDVESAGRSLERAFALAPEDALVRGRTVALIEAVRGDMARGPGESAPGWLLELAGRMESEPARAGLWLAIGELRLRAQDGAGAAAAWQQVFRLAAPGGTALAVARAHLGTLGAGGDLQAQRLALQRLLEDEDQVEERLHMLGRLIELGEALGDEGLVASCCREVLGLARSDAGHDDAREQAAVGLRGVFARRGAVSEIAALYAAMESEIAEPERAAGCLVEAARFVGQVVHDGALAATLACRAWRRAPQSLAAQGLLAELVEHAAHGEALLDELAEEALGDSPALALKLAEVAVRLGRGSEAQGWLREVAERGPGRLRRVALGRLDELLAGSGAAAERLPVLRALVAELRGGAGDGAVEGVSGDRLGVSGDRLDGSGDRAVEDVSGDRLDVSGDRLDVSGDRAVEDVSGDRLDGSGDRSVEDVSGDRWEVRALELARLELELGEVDAALGTCLPGAVGEAGDAGLLELAAELLAQREQWAELAAVCERRAELAALVGEGAVESGWLTRAAQVCIDHATHPRRAMHDARRLLLRACEADAGAEAARALLVPLSFAEHRWEEVLRVAEELRGLTGEDYDVQIVAAVTEAFVHGRSGLARAIGGRHDAATLRRLLWPAAGRVLTEVARAGTLKQLDAVLAAAAALHGSAARLRVELQAWSAGRSLQPGLTLGMARLHETIGHHQAARSLLQLAAFMVPQGPIAGEVAGLMPLPLPADLLAEPQQPSFESREALRAVLRRMAGETAGIRALGEAPSSARTPAEHEALALAEAELGPLRAALGLALPLLLGHGGPDGGVSVRNDRPPAIVVNAAFAGLPAAERRFRLALAAAMIASGLAIVTDPQGASLPELLAALLHLADETCPAKLPGSQTIVRACAARGFRRERLPSGLREALAREVGRWQESRESLARLAHLLRRDNLRVAARLSGSLDGALRTIGRDARLLGPGALDERGALLVLAGEDAQWLLRSLAVFS